jgi:hypothetical protein
MKVLIIVVGVVESKVQAAHLELIDVVEVADIIRGAIREPSSCHLIPANQIMKSRQHSTPT